MFDVPPASPANQLAAFYWDTLRNARDSIRFPGDIPAGQQPEVVVMGEAGPVEAAHCAEPSVDRVGAGIGFPKRLDGQKALRSASVTGKPANSYEIQLGQLFLV